MKEGLEFLKREESRRATGPLAFVKENIATFMDAEETLTGEWKTIDSTIQVDLTNCKVYFF